MITDDEVVFKYSTCMKAIYGYFSGVQQYFIFIVNLYCHYFSARCNQLPVQKPRFQRLKRCSESINAVLYWPAYRLI